MATLRIWSAVTLLACVALVLAYVPPRGNVPASGITVFPTQSPLGTPARKRAQALAEEARAADAAVRLFEERRAVRATTRPGVTLLLRSTKPVPATVTQRVAATLDSAWQSLGLADTKVRVGVVIDLGRTYEGGRPVPERLEASYLTPDSTDRTMCVALMQASWYWSEVILGNRPPHEAAPLTAWLTASLGPCAFYAKYGTPSKSVRRWLTARSWDVAGVLTTSTAAPSREYQPFLDPTARWFWSTLYSFPPSLVSCLAGREDGCRAAVVEGANRPERSEFHIIQPERRWWRAQRLLPAQRYLGDVAREVGPDRFQQFWTTSLPVDSALTIALKQPVGAWTAQWERRFVPPFRLGPAPGLGSAILAALLAAGAVLAVGLLAVRRQVR